MKNQNKIYGSLMDIFDYPKREAQIKQAIKMHILSEKGRENFAFLSIFTQLCTRNGLGKRVRIPCSPAAVCFL